MDGVSGIICLANVSVNLHPLFRSAIQLHENAMIVCDDDATLELRVKTVKYFRGLQETVERCDPHNKPQRPTSPRRGSGCH